MNSIECQQLLNGLEELNWNSNAHIQRELIEKLSILKMEDILKENYPKFIEQIERIYTFQRESDFKDKARTLLDKLREQV